MQWTGPSSRDRFWPRRLRANVSVGVEAKQPMVRSANKRNHMLWKRRILVPFREEVRVARWISSQNFRNPHNFQASKWHFFQLQTVQTCFQASFRLYHEHNMLCRGVCLSRGYMQNNHESLSSKFNQPKLFTSRYFPTCLEIPTHNLCASYSN